MNNCERIVRLTGSVRINYDSNLLFIRNPEH
jgi:hypothetical protein